jgi:NifU-like protein involved in Fe-S cluster formation
VAEVVNQPLYTVEILRLAASIPHLGRLPDPQGRAEVRSPTCGSTVTVEVKLDEHGRVEEIGQAVEACAFGQASAALMGAHAIGRRLPDIERALADLAGWLDGSCDHPGDWPGLEALAPARPRRSRHGAMLLPFRGLLAAIQNASGSEARSARTTAAR